MTQELLQKTCLKIENAFAHTPYPGDNKVGRYEVDDFRGHWKSIPLDTIMIHRDELAYFSPEGFRHYQLFF